MVKKRGAVWNYYHKKVDGTQVTAFCKFCDQSYIQNATRMERHLERCPKCPDEVKQQFLEMANIKKARNTIFNLRASEGWGKNDGKSTYDEHVIKMNNIARNSEEWQTSSEQWASQENAEVGHNESDFEAIEEKAWNEGMEEGIDEGEEEEEEAPETAMGGDSTQPHDYLRQIPLMPTSKMSYSIQRLQHNIYQEQLAEKRALRKTAELELKRKTLEFERIQWEFQRDKAHSELRWAHETRTMQMKEEKLRMEIERTRAQRQPSLL